MRLLLCVLPGTFTICRLAPDVDLPVWVNSGSFCSITRTSEELSIVVASDHVPAGVQAEGVWCALKVAGPIPLSSVGILASIAAPLACADISLFVVSTFDTDYVLVRAEQLESAVTALSGAGHGVT